MKLWCLWYWNGLEYADSQTELTTVSPFATTRRNVM